MLRRAASALGLAVAVAGLPFVLVAAAGPPSLEGLPTWAWLRTGMHNQYLPLDPLLRLLALLTWLLWLYLALTVALRTLAVVAARLHLAGSGALLAATEWLTLPRLRYLVDAAIGMSLLASSVSHPTIASPAHSAPAVSSHGVAASPAAWARTRTLLDVATPPGVMGRSVDEDRPDQATQPADPSAPDPPAAARTRDATPAPPTYVVAPGDSLWQIAERQLGDPLRWQELWQLNRDRRMPDGRTLHRPGLILPGWVLRLPADAARAAPPATVPPAAAPGPPPTHSPPPRAHGPTATRPPQPQTREPPPAQPQGKERHHEHLTGSAADHDGQPPRSHVVELPSGAVVGLSLALAISAALAAARLPRRRRWQPADPAPGISHTDPLVTDTVRRLHHAARTATAAGEPDDEQDDNDQTLAPRATEAPPAVPPTQTLPGPLGVVAVGHRDGSEVTLDLPATGGLALTGPGAPAAVRALVVTALASGPQHAVEVILAGADLADRLLPDRPTVPGLTIARDLDGALRHVEVELLERTRLLDDADVTTLAEFTASNPAEPLPLLVLVAETPPPILAGRLTAVLETARPLGIGAVVLGEAPGISALTVSADGDVDAGDHELPASLQPLTTVRLFTLGPDQARETLQLLATSRGEQPPPPPPLEDAAAPLPTAPQSVPDADDTQAIVIEPSPAIQPTPALEAGAGGAAAEPPIQVRVLGPIRIEAGGTEIHTGLRAKARELLALLLIHPNGIAAELAVETLWPNAPPPRGAERLQPQDRRQPGGQAKSRHLRRAPVHHRRQPHRLRPMALSSRPRDRRQRHRPLGIGRRAQPRGQRLQRLLRRRRTPRVGRSPPRGPPPPRHQRRHPPRRVPPAGRPPRPSPRHPRTSRHLGPPRRRALPAHHAPASRPPPPRRRPTHLRPARRPPRRPRRRTRRHHPPARQRAARLDYPQAISSYRYS